MKYGQEARYKNRIIIPKQQWIILDKNDSVLLSLKSPRIFVINFLLVFTEFFKVTFVSIMHLCITWCCEVDMTKHRCLWGRTQLHRVKVNIWESVKKFCSIPLHILLFIYSVKADVVVHLSRTFEIAIRQYAVSGQNRCVYVYTNRGIISFYSAFRQTMGF